MSSTSARKWAEAWPLWWLWPLGAAAISAGTAIFASQQQGLAFGLGAFAFAASIGLGWMAIRAIGRTMKAEKVSLNDALIALLAIGAKAIVIGLAWRSLPYLGPGGPTSLGLGFALVQCALVDWAVRAARNKDDA